jgi:membrane-bound serine protease (ClpP class)
MRGTGLLRSRRRIGEKEPMPKLWTSYGLFLLLLVVAVLSQRTAGAVGQTGSVVVAEYDGIVHPIAAEYIDDMIARAERADAVAAIVILRTPGGLLDSTRTIITRIIEARRPVVVFIAPSGSRAASAGFLITLAADVAAMAPGTHIGAAHPIPAGGQIGGDSTVRDKAASDTAAYARTLAQSRGRNVTLAEEAVLHSRAFTEQEALTAKPPLIDLVVPDLDGLLSALDGREVTRFNGEHVTLLTQGAVVERFVMTRRQQLLGAIAHPQIAALLLTLGMLGLVVEFWNPGAIAPGVAGGICLLLAFFAFQIVPVNIAGVLLLVLGLVLLVVEVTVPSFGILGVGGIVALIAGGVMLVREVPGIAVNYGGLVTTALVAAAAVLLLGRLAMRAQRQPPATGVAAMLGEQGRALTAIEPAGTGQVTVHGEIWRATSDAPIRPGERVQVLAVNGLTLSVGSAQEAPLEKGETG